MDKSDMARYLMMECTGLKSLGTCFHRETSAALWTPEYIYFGVAGDPDEPCRNEDDCTRYDASSVEKYKVCPSSCAESMAILAALEDGADFDGSFLVATDFPCGRCTEIASFMANQGMHELVFGTYGKGERPKDLTHGLWMQDAGIRISQLCGDELRSITFPESARANLPYRIGVDYFLRNTKVHRATKVDDIHKIPKGHMPIKIHSDDYKN